jgi:glycosyltransferase involved in cell wall biosynthesis
MFSSTIIATIGHPKLAEAVQSVLDQQFTAAGFEVIVVNDTGEPLPDMDWQRSEQVQVITTQKRERSVARNTGAAVARGKYLHFLDQDDLMLPGALQAFWEFDRATDAVWLYGSYQSMDDAGNVLLEFHPEVSGDFFAAVVAGEFIPFHASLLRAKAFFAAGGFDPGFIIVEDLDLGRRIARLGPVAKTPAIVARIRVGRAGSTGDWSRLPEFWHKSREKILDQPDVLARLSHSAGASSYLRGRVGRIYLASFLWNLKHRNLFIAASRCRSLVAFSAFHALSGAYWRGLRHHQQTTEMP